MLKSDYTAEASGQRILFNGVPYHANASSNAASSPWAPLTQEQINRIETEPGGNSPDAEIKPDNP